MLGFSFIVSCFILYGYFLCFLLCYFLSLSRFPSLVIVLISFTCPCSASSVFSPHVFSFYNVDSVRAWFCFECSSSCFLSFCCMFSVIGLSLKLRFCSNICLPGVHIWNFWGITGSLRHDIIKLLCKRDIMIFPTYVNARLKWGADCPIIKILISISIIKLHQSVFKTLSGSSSASELEMFPSVIMCLKIILSFLLASLQHITLKFDTSSSSWLKYPIYLALC